MPGINVVPAVVRFTGPMGQFSSTMMGQSGRSGKPGDLFYGSTLPADPGADASRLAKIAKERVF